ncbi:MAG TPA: AMIN domain-containing protein, partial [Noviherbaspirillum sp.]
MINQNYRALVRGCVAVCIAGAFGISHAQENTIESIAANQQGSNVIVKVAMKNPVQKPPIGFSITSPARIALDFAGTNSTIKTPMQEIGVGDVRSVNIVQAGDRSRLVFNLNRPLNYATAVDGNIVTVTID